MEYIIPHYFERFRCVAAECEDTCCAGWAINIDEKALDEQLTKADCDDRRTLSFHKMLLNGELPLTIGGGIGQSRLCMLILQKAHIGQVQVSIWDKETKRICKENGITLL